MNSTTKTTTYRHGEGWACSSCTATAAPPPGGLNWVEWAWAIDDSWFGVCSRDRDVDQVDQREDGDPDDVDEVPVQAADLRADVVAAVEAAPNGPDKTGQQPQHADEDVGAVETGQQEEALAKDAAGERDPLDRELGEFERLAAEEGAAE